MKARIISLMLFGLLFIGCEKEDSSVTPTPNPSAKIFTSSNVKTAPVYFSFAKGDTVSSTAAWDLKLTTGYAPDDSARSFPSFPAIKLNSALNVMGTYVDAKYESVDASTVTGLTKDVTDSLVTDSTRSIKSMPVYYSFDKRDTTTADGNWDVKFTVNAAMEPLIVLNKNKGVTGATFDATPFSTYNASKADLSSDVNDTTLVIGNKCFLYAGPPTHKLNPVANRTFVVRTINGARVKFQTLSYYNAAGASGFVKLQYVAPERYAIGTFCLSYNSNTHILSPYTDRTFVVKTSAGAVAKFKMLTYYNEASASGYMKFQYEVK